MKPPFTHYSSIWIIVVAVGAVSGEPRNPIALAAKDVGTGCLVEIGAPKLHGMLHPPYPTGPRVLLVTVDAHDVVACLLALGWRLPERIIDLMVEFRNISNGRRDLQVAGLAGALLWFGRPAAIGLIAGSAPEQMRQRVEMVAGLFNAMLATLDLGHALMRGRYMCAVARIEAVGVPIDKCASSSSRSIGRPSRTR